MNPRFLSPASFRLYHLLPPLIFLTISSSNFSPHHATISSQIVFCVRQIQAQLRPSDTPLFPLHQAQRRMQLRK